MDPDDDIDLLDGCDVDFSEDPTPDDELALRALFPDGNPMKAAEWRELFGVAQD